MCEFVIRTLYVYFVTFAVFSFQYTARNALVVFVAAMIGYCLKLQPWFEDQITLIDYSYGSLPPVQVPDPTSDVCSVSVRIFLFRC